MKALEVFISLSVAFDLEFWQLEYSVNKKQTKKIVNNNGTGNNSQTKENTGAENTQNIQITNIERSYSLVFMRSI